MKILVKNGSDPSAIDNQGNTAIIYAAKSKALNCVKVLAKKMKFQDIFRKNKEGLDILTIASDSGMKSFLKTLLIKAHDRPSFIPVKDAKETKKKPPETTVNAEDFLIVQKLGGGSFGEVFLVEKKDTRCLYAMKVLQKSLVFSINFQVDFSFILRG